MQTARDAEIIRWLGRIGAASAEDVMGRFDMGRSWAYARLNRLVRDGLLEQKTLLRASEHRACSPSTDHASLNNCFQRPLCRCDFF
jgi:hypothetical protein